MSAESLEGLVQNLHRTIPWWTAGVDGGTLIEFNGGSGSFLFMFNPFPCFQTHDPLGL